MNEKLTVMEKKNEEEVRGLQHELERRLHSQSLERQREEEVRLAQQKAERDTERLAQEEKYSSLKEEAEAMASEWQR